MSQHQDNTNSAGLSRREILRRASVGSAGVAAGFSIASGSLAVPAALAAPRAQGTQRKVIFVNHDNNPFFVRDAGEIGRLPRRNHQDRGSDGHDTESHYCYLSTLTCVARSGCYFFCDVGQLHAWAIFCRTAIQPP